MARSKSDYALLWANGASFSDIYDMIKSDAVEELARPESPPQLRRGDTIAALTEDVKVVRGKVKTLLAADFGEE